MRGNSKVLLAGGIVATALAAGAVVWGRVRSVEVPRVGEWEAVPLVCAVGVDRVALGRALDAVRDHGHRARLLPPSDPCAPGDGVISIAIDQSLDDATIASSAPVGIEAHDGELSPLSPQTWGVTACSREGRRIVRCHVRLHPQAGELAIAHELLHAHGWEHPPLAPTGHVLHPSSPGLRDWRGVDGGAR